MKYSKIKNYDVANGPGLRVSIWVSGCRFHCKDCFNEEAWSFDAGEEFTRETMDELLKLCDNEHISGLSILGGEPLDVINCKAVFDIVQCFKQYFGTRKNIWLWTGYKVDENDEMWGFNESQFNVVKLVDVIVDGTFDTNLVKGYHRFRGSSNQQIWAWRGETYGEQLTNITNEIDRNDA